MNIGSGSITESSPVVFMDSSMGNFRINQDPNQIIVIPLDCYKQGGNFEGTNNQDDHGDVIISTANHCNQVEDLSYQGMVQLVQICI